MVTTTTITLTLQRVTLTGNGDINFTSGYDEITFTEEATDDLAAETTWIQNFTGDPTLVPTGANVFGDIDGSGGTEYTTVGGNNYEYEYLGYHPVTVDGVTSIFAFVYIDGYDGGQYYAINLQKPVDPPNGSTGFGIDDLIKGELYVGEGGVTLPCFTSGTKILTKKGEVLIDDLAPGDLIYTHDGTYKPLRWIGKTVISSDQLEKHPEFRPIRIPKDFLGKSVPSRDIWLSPQHKVLISSLGAELLFSEELVLMSAKDLMGDMPRNLSEMPKEVTYYHILFDQHECVYTEGLISESFNPSSKNVGMFDKQTRDEILKLFPELKNHHSQIFESSYMELKSHESLALKSFGNT